MELFFSSFKTPGEAVMRRCKILTVKGTCIFIIKARLLKAIEDESCRLLVNVLKRDRKDTFIVSTADMVVVVSGAGMAATVVVAEVKIIPVVKTAVVATVVDVGDSIVEGTGPAVKTF